jgi:hypothetical protein
MSKDLDENEKVFNEYDKASETLYTTVTDTANTVMALNKSLLEKLPTLSDSQLIAATVNAHANLATLAKIAKDFSKVQL